MLSRTLPILGPVAGVALLVAGLASGGCAGDDEDDYLLFHSAGGNDGNGGVESRAGANGQDCRDGDSDSDGVCDAVDACEDGDDHQDADSDGIPDACDACGVGALLALGPLAFYRFGETSGAVATSSVATGADGEYVGATLGAEGISEDGDPAVSLNGTVDSYVIVDPVAAFPTGDFTVALWVNLAAAGFTEPTMFSYASSGEFNEIVIAATPTYAGSFTNYVLEVTVSDQAWETDAEVALSRWLHVAVTWASSSGSVAVYLDGTQVAATDGLAAGASLPAAGVAVVGQEQDSLGDRFQSEQSLEGSVDEVLVFDRQLSASEVAEIYSATICD